MRCRPCGTPGGYSDRRRGPLGSRGGSRRSGPVLVVFAWVAPWLSASCTIPIKTGPGFGGQAMSMVLVEADPALLLPKEAAVLEARHFLPDLRPALTERLRMLSWDEATCWRKLEEF